MHYLIDMEFDIIVKNILENFKDSIMTDDKGTKRSVESVVRFAENNKEKYFKKNFPINKLEHDLKWWDDQNKKDTKRLYKYNIITREK